MKSVHVQGHNDSPFVKGGRKKSMTVVEECKVHSRSMKRIGVTEAHRDESAMSPRSVRVESAMSPR